MDTNTKHFEVEVAQKGFEKAIAKGYVLRSFVDKDYDQLPTMDFIFQDDPLCSGVVATGEIRDLLAPAWKYLMEIINDGLGVGLFEGDNIIAVCLCNDILTQYSQEKPKEGMQALQNYLEVLDHSFRSNRVFIRGETMYCFLLGVVRGYRGNGFSYVVLAEAARQGRLKGYKELFLEASNPLTLGITKKLFVDSKATAQIETQKYVDKNGNNPFGQKTLVNSGVWANIHS